MKKRFVSLLTAGILGISLAAGCGNSETVEGEGSSTPGQAGADTAADSGGSESEGEVTEIEMYALALGETGGLKEVEDAVNVIAEEKANVHVNLTLMDASSYMEQMGLMLAGNERVDLMQITPLGSVGFNACQSQNQLQDISELISKEAPQLTETVGAYLKGMEVEGSLYGVPGFRLLNSNMYVYMRGDVLDELGLRQEAEAGNSWSGREAIFEKVYHAQDSLPEELRTSYMIANTGGTGDVITTAPALAGNDDWSQASGYDTLGDSYYIVGVDEAADTVFSWYESEDFHKEIQIPTIVSLNPIMVDGTGMCGACRVTVGDEVKFACVDGPEFDGHKVNFDEAMKRQQMYKTEEGRAMLKLQEGETHHGGCGHCGGEE